MTSISLTTWRSLVDGAATRIAQALVDELGPTRATTAALTTGPDQVAVALQGPSPDRWSTMWVAVVELSALWAAGVFDQADVDLVVDVDGLCVTTPADTMAAVAAGEGFDGWRAAVSFRPAVKAV